MAKPGARKIYRLKVHLTGSKPPVWRRFLVSDSVDLGLLHVYVRRSMGWGGGHLHCFMVGDMVFAPNEDSWSGCNDFGSEGELDEDKVLLRQVLKEPGQRMRYVYDYGDCWRHDITLEEVCSHSDAIDLPFLLAASGRCPPDDCGGISEYNWLLAALKDPSHPDHQTSLELLGEGYDPKKVDIEELEHCFT